MRRTTWSRRRSLPRRRGARSSASTSKNSRGSGAPTGECGDTAGGERSDGVALAATNARAASASPAAKSAARRRLRGRCFFLEEDRLKLGGVAGPGVAIGDGSPAAGGERWRGGLSWGTGGWGWTAGMERRSFINVNCEAAQLRPSRFEN